MRSTPLPPARLLAGALLAALAQAAPARAAELAVTAPPGYTATPMATTGQQAARYAVRKPTDQDTGCQVAYTPAPQNNSMSQEQVNTLLRTPGWQNITRATLERIYEIRSMNTVEVGNRTGLQIQADFKPLQGLPPRSQQLRSSFGIFETPQGRTTTVCVFEKAEADARQGEFLALLRGITAP
ncbi:hypothetical protein [Pseudoroseomonas cervicalis]|uniref:hypothetical protein n=1 Tax=Teichococcus cervicalis TaxID=204525 RepID=UPI0022F1C71B|nr:hypothetical protein [Pseudoroseomonas cervicalis]WBV41893.1 hypothetical protein PFY06_11660 [Pseudoroseomonas cervicalis]